VPGLFLLGSLRRIISKSPFFGLNFERRTSNKKRRMQRLADQTGETVCRPSPTGESTRNLLRRDRTARNARLFKTSFSEFKKDASVRQVSKPGDSGMLRK
jgi:hypothetical protein